MSRNIPTLEERVTILEKDLLQLKSRLSGKGKQAWWQEISGVFENDPAFDEISVLGQAIREQERADVKS